jgi:biotin-dependent carboxylase-like uncharacterized protein
MLEVVTVGMLATIQDRGRAGYAHLGVPRSGAVDPPAHGLANRLVGNDSGAAAVELAHGRFTARFEASAFVAVTGAPAPVWVDGRAEAFGVPVRVSHSLRIGAPMAGVYTYVAVQGGVDVAPVLGSRSTDTLSGLGPPPLRVGDRLAFGTSTTPASVDFSPLVRAVGDEIRVRVRSGPRDDWFDDHLVGREYRVGAANRIGVRLTGLPVRRRDARELPSEGLVSGAIQIPGDGLPIVFLADHPTTGGYPVIGVVHPEDLPLLAQARAGARVVFCGP